MKMMHRQKILSGQDFLQEKPFCWNAINATNLYVEHALHCTITTCLRKVHGIDIYVCDYEYEHIAKNIIRRQKAIRFHPTVL